eukprot:PhF_6_TR4823/c0_g1_i1/m.6676
MIYGVFWATFCVDTGNALCSHYPSSIEPPYQDFFDSSISIDDICFAEGCHRNQADEVCSVVPLRNEEGAFWYSIAFFKKESVSATGPSICRGGVDQQSLFIISSVPLYNYIHELKSFWPSASTKDEDLRKLYDTAIGWCENPSMGSKLVQSLFSFFSASSILNLHWKILKREGVIVFVSDTAKDVVDCVLGCVELLKPFEFKPHEVLPYVPYSYLMDVVLAPGKSTFAIVGVTNETVLHRMSQYPNVTVIPVLEGVNGDFPKEHKALAQKIQTMMGLSGIRCEAQARLWFEICNTKLMHEMRARAGGRYKSMKPHAERFMQWNQMDVVVTKSTSGGNSPPNEPPTPDLRDMPLSVSLLLESEDQMQKTFAELWQQLNEADDVFRHVLNTYLQKGMLENMCGGQAVTGVTETILSISAKHSEKLVRLFQREAKALETESWDVQKSLSFAKSLSHRLINDKTAAMELVICSINENKSEFKNCFTWRQNVQGLHMTVGYLPCYMSYSIIDEALIHTEPCSMYRSKASSTEMLSFHGTIYVTPHYMTFYGYKTILGTTIGMEVIPFQIVNSMEQSSPNTVCVSTSPELKFYFTKLSDPSGLIPFLNVLWKCQQRWQNYPSFFPQSPTSAAPPGCYCPIVIPYTLYKGLETVHNEVWENQRLHPTTGWCSNMGPNDPAPWSDYFGSISIRPDSCSPPHGWRWTTEWEIASEWFYSQSWSLLQSTKEPQEKSLCRRRRWVRGRWFVEELRIE